MKRMWIFCLSLVLCAALVGGAQAARFWYIDLYGERSDAWGVSADGSVVVGWYRWGDWINAFRWTQSSGAIALGFLDDSDRSQAYDVSVDGSFVVGRSGLTEEHQAFRWTQSDGMVGLGYLPDGGPGSSASGVSADGSIVVGDCMLGFEGNEAFRWTQSDGMVGLGYLSDGDYMSYAFDVSADGSTVVGSSGGIDVFQAFRWTQSDGMVGLGYLHDGDYRSVANGVSADGSVVVGYSTSSSSRYAEAFRWTESDKMVGLGFLADSNESVALDVSGDGSTVVGYSGSGYNTEAFIWDKINGIRNLKDLLTDIGHLDLNGWNLDRATAISSDGNTIVGSGTSPNGIPQGWIAKLEKKEDFPWEIFIPLFKKKPKIF